MSDNHELPFERPALRSVPDAAKYLSVSRATFYRIGFDLVKIGRCARVRQTDLDAFVATGRVKAA